MKNVPSLCLVGLVCLAWPALAADVDLSKLPPASDRQGVTYAKDIRPIFQTTCFGCHGEERQKAHLRLDSLEAALKGSEDGKVILPGNSKESPIVVAVARLDEEKAMPPKPRAGRGPGGPGGPRGRGAPGGPQNRRQGGPGGFRGNGPGAGPGGPGGPGGGRGPFGPPPKPLTAEQVGLIRAWIDQGAK